MTQGSERPLSDREQLVVAKILSVAAGTGPLVAQLPVARIVSGPITFLDLAVPDDAPRADLADGLLPITADVTDADGGYIGEILLWIEHGRLSALEYAWVTDDPPTEWPEPERVHVEYRIG
ncbi:hypothetical protein LZG04_41255 [Saccharothrix sp. S26]|uniref:hypothetical protein n=1 Tax=Saccharothrix sp. S26 TaxID=2907215 RepID=UPI001F1DF44E|nr:hypothetical protein [Saccharothrix sp. S26]MCE7001205.1 hypothetical protein [Saccharothrix sp. S26]